MTKWSELDGALRRIAFRDGIKKTADRIPADRNTVYRIIKGETKKPSAAVQAGVERIVRDDNQKNKP